MKKNNGFTLIELLATIIILAGIALVAFPILLNTIKNSENKIDEKTRQLVINAAKLYIDNHLNDYPKTSGNTYCVSFDQLIKGNHLEKEILEATDIDASEKVVKVTVTEAASFDYEIEDIQNCTINKICTLVNDLNNDGLSYGDEYECDPGDGTSRTFYVLEIGGETTLTKGETGLAGYGEVSLIMDRNYDLQTLKWCDQSGETPINNICNADGLTGKLAEIKNNWTNTQILSIDLPTAYQIANAGNLINWTPSGDSEGNLPEWLYTNLYVPDNSLPYGYWTSTPHSVDNEFAWFVNYGYTLYKSGVSDDNYGGVRPVITISKQHIN